MKWLSLNAINSMLRELGMVIVVMVDLDDVGSMKFALTTVEQYDELAAQTNKPIEPKLIEPIQ